MIDEAKASAAAAVEMSMKAVVAAEASSEAAGKCIGIEKEAERHQASDEGQSSLAEESSIFEDDSFATDESSLPNVEGFVLSDSSVRETQKNDENIKSWIRVAELKDTMIKLQAEYDSKITSEEPVSVGSVRSYRGSSIRSNPC